MGAPMALARRVLDAQPDLLAAHADNPRAFPCLLESVSGSGGREAFDLLFATDGHRIEAPTTVPVAGGGRPFLDALDREWAAERQPRGEADADLPFRGGWVLMLGYELAGECEPRLRLPRSPSGMPYALALRAPAAAIRDRRSGRTTLVAEAGFEWLLDRLESALCGTSPAILPWSGRVTIEEDDAQRFIQGVACIRDYLAAGDVFQVNLSRQWRARLPVGCNPATLYAALRLANPAPFAGSFRDGEHAVLSSSPERLVRVSGRLIETRPIAGTRPRFPGDDDQARVRELVGHPKERAEHVMLLDLERNDLGRVSEPGSVEVSELMGVETWAHVHHIVSNVRGRLTAGATPGRILQALFPGGTITGAPKVRCMEIIAELEGEGRGAYTGSLGWLNRDGDMDLNILIRTLELDGSGCRLRAGSGIVFDSVPERELDETRAKARGLLRALDGGAP
jgi:anthranilate synthase component 1